MSLDDSKMAHWEAMQRRHGRLDVDPELPLKGGGGGGTYGGMESRVAKLEAYMDVTRDDLKDIKGDLRDIKDSVGKLATKSDMDSWKWQWVGVALTVIVLAITGIVGGLTLVAYALTPH